MATTDMLKQTIVEAFQSQVYVDNRMDVQHTPLYDTVTIAAGSSLSQLTSAFFTNVGPASSKTLAQTNMTQSQRLPAPEAFSIFGVAIRFAENILLADFLSIMNGFAFALYLGQKRYQLAPLWHFPAGGGVTGAFTKNDTAIYQNGVPQRSARLSLAVPIVIENQMTFYGQLEGNAYTLTSSGSGGTGVTMTVELDGLYARGVQ